MNIKKKTYLLPQDLIDQMKKVFNVETETKAIINAMQEIVFRREVSSWHRKHKGKVNLKNVYA